MNASGASIDHEHSEWRVTRTWQDYFGRGGTPSEAVSPHPAEPDQGGPPRAAGRGGLPGSEI